MVDATTIPSLSTVEAQLATQRTAYNEFVVLSRTDKSPLAYCSVTTFDDGQISLTAYAPGDNNESSYDVLPATTDEREWVAAVSGLAVAAYTRGVLVSTANKVYRAFREFRVEMDEII